MERITVKTKSGAKIHTAPVGSSITICGIRFAVKVKLRIGTAPAHYCVSCGMSPLAVEVGESLSRAFTFAKRST